MAGSSLGHWYTLVVSLRSCPPRLGMHFPFAAAIVPGFGVIIHDITNQTIVQTLPDPGYTLLIECAFPMDTTLSEDAFASDLEDVLAVPGDPSSEHTDRTFVAASIRLVLVAKDSSAEGLVCPRINAQITRLVRAGRDHTVRGLRLAEEEVVASVSAGDVSRYVKYCK